MNKELPINDKLFEEGMQRLVEYIVRYVRLSDNYRKYVQLCIQSETIPQKWEKWID